MSCNLSDGELYILNILYQRGCLNMAAGKNSKQIEKYYIKRGFSKDYDDAIHTLLNDGYITKIKKLTINFTFLISKKQYRSFLNTVLM